jgi:hypothetical protein
MAGTQPAAAPANLKAYYGGRYFKGAAEGDFAATGPTGNVGNPPVAFDKNTMSDVPTEEPVVEEAPVVAPEPEPEPEPAAQTKPKAPSRRKPTA